MEAIEITDNRQSQITIGKVIYESHPEIYTSGIVKRMKETINRSITDEILALYTEEEFFFHSIYDYWVYGNDVAEDMYFGFWKKTHLQKSEYTTNKTMLKYIYHLNKKENAYLLDDKYEAYKRLKQYYRRDVIQISSKEDYSIFLDFVKKHPVFVAKPSGAALAIGVKKIETTPSIDLSLLFESLLKDGLECQEKHAFVKKSSVVLEEVIQQDKALAKIHPYSVNGIRVTTLRLNDDVHILYPWFKVGSNKGFVTSAAFGTYDAGIDLHTGIVNTDGFKENGTSDTIHPTTGIQFKGYVIPRWNELVQVTKKLAMILPDINYVGWDMVLTESGWIVMEGNFGGDFMWQMFYQKGFKKELETLINWKPQNYFWWQ